MFGKNWDITGFNVVNDISEGYLNRISGRQARICHSAFLAVAADTGEPPGVDPKNRQYFDGQTSSMLQRKKRPMRGSMRTSQRIGRFQPDSSTRLSSFNRNTRSVRLRTCFCHEDRRKKELKPTTHRA
eukprot:gb/GECG01004988.1/.p1 GENE.gb/GECG01004988.1/~~gb/GECG01004988.1/.p1  ORF type:complete len:128 (+),score=7.02 gb/GECG01004988.1/:1-384(+)